jgi:hypothetical protein
MCSIMWLTKSFGVTRDFSVTPRSPSSTRPAPNPV